MPRQPIGPVAMTATERSRHRREKRAEYIAALERAVVEASVLIGGYERTKWHRDHQHAIQVSCHHEETIHRARAAQTKES